MLSNILFSLDHEGVQGTDWSGHNWSVHPASVPQAPGQEVKGEVSPEAKPLSRGLHLRHGSQEGEEVQPVPGLAARLNGLKEGKDGKVNKNLTFYISSLQYLLLCSRFFMTAPPVLSSKKSIRKILAVTCPNCGKCYLLTLS